MSAASMLDQALDEVMSVGTWPTNADLIADVARLGYLDGTVLDATYGLGRFWTAHRPDDLVGVDIDPRKSQTGEPVDFRRLPYADRSFATVVLDAPYKLNGTPSGNDEDYGVHVPTDWRDRMALMLDGAIECARVADRYLIVKCQDQVVSGRVRWQTDAITEAVTACGFRKVDRFEFGAGRGRKQPDGRRQVHARHDASQLLIFGRGRVDNGQPSEPTQGEPN